MKKVSRVYLLIKTDVGREEDVYTKLGEFEEVKTRDIVTGPYDVVVVMEGDLAKIEELVVSKIRRMDGVRETITLVALTS